MVRVLAFETARRSGSGRRAGVSFAFESPAPGVPPVQHRLRFPIGPISPADADRLALRAAQVMAAFLLLGLAGSFLFRGAPEGVSELGTGAAMLLAVPLISRSPVFGKIFSLRTLGLRGDHPLRLIGLGVFGFLLELPVSYGLTALGATLLRNLPQSEHPTLTGLAQTPSPLNILGTLFFAAVVAPFWEETMFRGMLFPAISRVAKSPWIGGIVSCFLFASVHPQGIPLWLGLASVAAFSCVLALRTGNLWPSVVMHVCHNLTLVVVQVLMN